MVRYPQLEAGEIQLGFSGFHFLGFLAPSFGNGGHGGKLDVVQRGHVVFHVAAAGNLYRLRFAPLAVFVGVVVDIIRFFRVLDVDFNARTAAAIELNVLEYIQFLARELRQGFERIFCRLQSLGVAQEVVHRSGFLLAAAFSLLAGFLAL